MDMADYIGGIVEFIILRTFISLKKSSHYTANFLIKWKKFAVGMEKCSFFGGGENDRLHHR